MYSKTKVRVNTNISNNTFMIIQQTDSLGNSPHYIVIFTYNSNTQRMMWNEERGTQEQLRRSVARHMVDVYIALLTLCRATSGLMSV